MDIYGKIASGSYACAQSMWLPYHNLMCYMRARFWRVSLGQRCSFYGHTFFKRATGSVIEIEQVCTFRSSVRSNLIGVNRPCMISTLGARARISVGACCSFSGTTIAASRSISLGRNVRCGANTTIMDTDWHEDDPRSGTPQEVVMGDGVWLGLNAIVLKGVTIGENSVIGAGSIVTRSIPANVVAVGQPAKVIKTLDEMSIRRYFEFGKQSP